MCIGQAMGVHLADGDRYILHYEGQKYPFVLKQTPNGFVLVHDSSTPFGPPLGALPFSEKGKYDFERISN